MVLTMMVHVHSLSCDFVNVYKRMLRFYHSLLILQCNIKHGHASVAGPTGAAMLAANSSNVMTRTAKDKTT